MTITNPPAPARKLPFKRTAPRKPAETKTETATTMGEQEKGEDALGIFRQSTHYFKEQERWEAERQRAEMERKEREKREERLAKEEEAREEEERERERERQREREESLTQKRELDSSSSPPPLRTGKRRRLTPLTAGGDAVAKGRIEGKSFVRSERKTSNPFMSPSQEMKPRSSAPLSRSVSAVPTITLIDSDDDDDNAADSQPTTNQTTPRISQATQPSRSPGPTLPPGPSNEDTVPTDTTGDDDLDEVTKRYIMEARQRRELALSLEQTYKDVKLKLSIEPRIPHLQPLSIAIKILQKMDGPKSLWIAQMLIHPDCAANYSRPELDAMFFTWKGQRIYPHTTMASLGICPDETGRLYSTIGPAESRREGFNTKNRVLLEVWTDEAYAEDERRRDHERRLRMGDDDEDDGDAAAAAAGGSHNAVAMPAVEEKKGIRLKLKSREFGTQTLANVALDCEVRTIARAFLVEKKLAPGTALEIHFDGDRLDPRARIDEVGIEDEDCLEVHPRG